MKRENRYVAFKIKDIKKYLSRDQREFLNYIDGLIDSLRFDDGKTPLKCVVVEHDWPEYEPTWKMIEKRVDAIK